MSNAPAPTLLLVHGAHSGTWVWDHVVPLLKSPHRAIDLPGHGARTEPLGSVTLSACAAAVVQAAADLPQLVLVAHSMGVPIALKAADSLQGRLAHIVLIAGPVPTPGTCIVDNFPLIPRWVSKVVLKFQSELFSQPDGIGRSLLQGCPEDKIAFALPRFKLESTKIVTEPVAWSGKPPAPATYVKCLRDKGALHAHHQDAMAARLGVAPTAFDTCHYPMLERPADVAALLDRVAGR